MTKTNQLKYDIGDPVAKLLIERIHLTPFSFALVWTLIVVVVSFLTSLVSNSLFSNSSGTGLISDWIWWVWSLVFTPVLAGYYLWSSKAIESVALGLERSEILSISSADIKAVIGYFQKPWRRILALCMMLVVGILYYISRGKLSGFASSSLAARLETSVMYAILSYFVTVLICNLVVNYWAIRRIVQGKQLNINPLHPDRCGGLKILSDYSIRVVYLNAICGILVSLTVYRLWLIGYGWAAVSIVVFYLGVATVIFFAPLSTAHEEMDEAKSKLLLKLGKQFWKDYLAAHQAVGGDTESLKDEIAKIKQLQELYDLTREFPVWPFDTITLRRFVITITSPLIPPLIGLLIDYLTKKVIP